jgi:hypothetical protein
MELEELKNLWTSLEEKLEKQEVLKESIIKEMIYEKSNKSLSKLLNFDIFSITICLIALPFVAFLYNTSKIEVVFGGRLFCYIMFLFLIANLIIGAIHLKYLTKIDFSKRITINSLYINKYNILIKKEKIASVFIIVILFSFGIYLYAALHASFAYWIFLVSIYIIGIILTYYQYRNLYDKNIASIQKSLEELKELEE